MHATFTRCLESVPVLPSFHDLSNRQLKRLCGKIHAVLLHVFKRPDQPWRMVRHHQCLIAHGFYQKHIRHHYLQYNTVVTTCARATMLFEKHFNQLPEYTLCSMPKSTIIICPKEKRENFPTSKVYGNVHIEILRHCHLQKWRV